MSNLVQIEGGKKPNTNSDGADGGSGMTGLNERLAKLEGVVDGLKDRLTTTTAVLAIVISILSGLMIYELTRLDKIQDKIDDLPGKINTGLQQTISTLSASITAAKQQAPQVILVPAPAQKSTAFPHQ